MMNLVVGGTKQGRIQIWQVISGQLIGDVVGAHFGEVTDLDIAMTGDMVITAGRDCKVKVWLLSALINNQSAAQDD